MRNSIQNILSVYKKEDLINIYDEQRNIYKVADTVQCDYATLVKVFNHYNIPIGKFCHKPLVVKKLSHLTKENLELLLKSNTIKQVATKYDSHPGQIVARMTELNIQRNRKQPHRRNHQMLSIPDGLFREAVEFRGILNLAKELSCSQSSVRDRANKLNIQLVAGPHKALTETVAWSQQCRENRMNQPEIFKNTSIEIALQAELTRRGVSFELHPKIINLTVPDVFIKPNICIYADGCYWHGCPTCNVSDRNSGLKYTRSHDNFVDSQLKKAGYVVARIWEHDIKTGNFTGLDSLK